MHTVSITTCYFPSIMMHSIVIIHRSSVRVLMRKFLFILEYDNLSFWQIDILPFDHHIPWSQSMSNLLSFCIWSNLKQTHKSQIPSNFLNDSHHHLFNVFKMGIDLISISSCWPIFTFFSLCCHRLLSHTYQSTRLTQINHCP